MGFVKNNPFADEFGELLRGTGRQLKALPTDLAKSAKGQIFTSSASAPLPSEKLVAPPKTTAKSPKIDQVTGAPVPSKQVVSYLTNALERRDVLLLKEKRKQILLELEKQRLKQEGEDTTPISGAGPEIKKDKKPRASAIQTATKNALTTGEANRDASG